MTNVTITPLVKGLSATQQETNHALITIEGVRKKAAKRKPVNLVLAIDVSSSMSGDKLKKVQHAACTLIDQLLATDQVGVVSFGSEVKVMHNVELLENRNALKTAIKSLTATGSTALHPGWAKSAELLEALDLKGRILLLSDGEANIGLTDIDMIATTVKNKSKLGITTSTMGVGAHFNEDLLESMALSGEGNYFYVEDAENLEEIFSIELSGVQARIGTNLELTIEPQHGATLVKVVQPYSLDGNKIQVGAILSGVPINILVEFTTPISTTELEVLKLTAKYTEITSSNNETPTTLTTTLSLPVVDSEWMEVNQDDAVKERIAIAKADELRQEALNNAKRGNSKVAREYLVQAGALLNSFQEKGPLLIKEIGMLDAVMSRVQSGAILEATKLSKGMTYSHSNTLVGGYMSSSFIKPLKKPPNGNNL